MQESMFFPRFEKFKHFDTLTYLYPQNNSFNSQIDNLKQIIQDPTREQKQEKEKYKTRSVKVWASPLNISFQEGFMDEHKTCFEKQLWKYMEHQENLFTGLKSSTSPKKIFDLNDHINQSRSLVKYIRESENLLSEEQSQMLIIDLKRQDKLNDFLEYTIKKLNEAAIKQMIYLTNELWVEYIKIQDLNYSWEQVIEFSQSFTNSHLSKLDEKFEYINFKYLQRQGKSQKSSHESKQRQNQFKKFITFFTTTLSLIISGFFQNPYTDTEENYYKRELNELGLGFQNDDEYHDRDFDSEDDQVVINKRIKP